MNDDFSSTAPLKHNSKKEVPGKIANAKQEELFPSLGSGSQGNPGFFIQASKTPAPFYMDLLPAKKKPESQVSESAPDQKKKKGKNVKKTIIF